MKSSEASLSRRSRTGAQMVIGERNKRKRYLNGNDRSNHEVEIECKTTGACPENVTSNSEQDECYEMGWNSIDEVDMYFGKPEQQTNTKHSLVRQYVTQVIRTGMVGYDDSCESDLCVDNAVNEYKARISIKKRAG